MKSGSLILAFLLGLSMSLSGQQHISFGYDNNGNRISRTLKVTVLKSGQLTFPVDLAKLEEQQEMNQGITVYPNPATTTLMIKIDGYTDILPKSITIYNLSGIILYRFENPGTENEINLTAFEDGIYVLRLLIGPESYTYKIIKSK